MSCDAWRATRCVAARDAQSERAMSFLAPWALAIAGIGALATVLLHLVARSRPAAYLLPTFGARATEHFGVVLLDTKHRVIRTAVIAVGTLNSTVVEPRDVFREAALGGAAAVIVFHNHPSGDPNPSPDDAALTRRLASAGVLMGVPMIDHIVLGDVRYYSFREDGKL